MSVTELKSWQMLQQHAAGMKECSLNDLFSSDNERVNNLTLRLDDLLVDISKQKINNDTLDLLYRLAEERNVKNNAVAMFAGEKINRSEQRAVLHTALRSKQASLYIDNIDVIEQVRQNNAHMYELADSIRNGSLVGSTNKAFKTIVNIGIGGSDLGPRLATRALHYLNNSGLEIRFVANIDLQDLHLQLENTDPETTLFIIASKSFGTLETLENANSAQRWLKKHGVSDIGRHFVAVTANPEAASKFGIAPDSILQFGEWVGGRYSLWSTIGLPLVIAIGQKFFQQMLDGAHVIDQHFINASCDSNIPLTLALIDIWNNNFLGAESLAVIPYDQGLSLLPDYLSQLMMESNGKRVTLSGHPVDYDTQSIIWGAVGSNSQHAFFQLLHQGTRNLPVEFLVARQSTIKDDSQHAKLIANCLAQAEALMLGKDATGENPHRHFPGNKPSTTILFDQLTPSTLGKILALYEHRTFVQACIWDINAFDQWGVELGKHLAGVITEELETGRQSGNHDASTTQLIQSCMKKT